MPTRKIVSSTKFVSIDNNDDRVYHFNLRNILYAIENDAKSTVTVIFTSGHQVELKDHAAALLIEELHSKNLSQQKIQTEKLTDTAFEFSLGELPETDDTSEISIVAEEPDDLSDIPAKISAAMEADRRSKRHR